MMVKEGQLGVKVKVDVHDSALVGLKGRCSRISCGSVGKSVISAVHWQCDVDKPRTATGRAETASSLNNTILVCSCSGSPSLFYFH